MSRRVVRGRRRDHRTDSIDYIIVITGEIDIELDDSVVHLKPATGGAERS